MPDRFARPARADGRRARARGVGARSRRSCSTTCRRRPSSLPDGRVGGLTDARRTLAGARRRTTTRRRWRRRSAGRARTCVRSLEEALGGRVQLHLTEFTEGVDLGSPGWGTAGGQPGRARPSRLARAAADGSGTTSSCGPRPRFARARREVLGDVAVEPMEAPLTAGFVFGPGRLAVVTEEDLFGARRHTRRRPAVHGRRTTASPTSSSRATSPCTGSTASAATRASCTASSPAPSATTSSSSTRRATSSTCRRDAVGMVARYIGGDVAAACTGWAAPTGPGRPRRSSVPCATWPASSCGSTRVRMSVPGHAFGPDTPWQRELEDAFPYEETPDQLRVIEEVKRDMERPVPMDRLLCGDVGFGKTEVAVRAAFKAVMGGKQVAVLVPTTLLAEQHFLTFRERFAPYPVTVRDAVAVRRRRRAGGVGRRHRGGQGRHRDRHAPAARHATCASPTSACWSSTRSSASASRTRSG